MNEIKIISVTGGVEETDELIQKKSKKLYQQRYEAFVNWCSEKKIEHYSESALVLYFKEKSETVRPSTLWAQYSMLKSMLNIKHNIDIGKYSQLIAFLKKGNDDYEAKTSKILTVEQIDQFLTEAPDKDFLMMKVALILGVAGACRGNELVDLTVDDVTELDSMLICQIRNGENKKDRSFIVKDIVNKDIKLIEICKKYIAARKEETPHSRFFVSYADNKCTTRPVGKNTIGKLPQKIAEYLNLPDVTAYTGHCFRRTSASLLAASGATADTLKQHGGWRSSRVPEIYVKNSVNNRKNKIQTTFGEEGPSSSSTIISESSSVLVQQSFDENIPSVHLVNCKNVNINITIKRE